MGAWRLMDEQEYKERIMGALQQGAEIDSKGVDLSGYPEDCRLTLLQVCDLWSLKPPRYKKDKGYWIEGARRLIDASGELGSIIILVEIHREWRNAFQNGLAPYIVEGPGSLVKLARAKAAEMRQKPSDAEDRSKYTGGKYADWIE